jgi:hypothetical protein
VAERSQLHQLQTFTTRCCKTATSTASTAAYPTCPVRGRLASLFNFFSERWVLAAL